VPATSARAFGDSVGVGVRLTWLDTSYGDFATLQARLRELGVRHVGDGMCPTCEYQIDRLKRLAADGIKANVAVGNLSSGTPLMQASLNAIRDRLPESVESVTPANEPDIEPVADWLGMTRDYQVELYRRVKSDPGLKHLAVLGPALVRRESRAELGDLSAHMDRGNIHPYPGGAWPYHNIVDEKQLASLVSGNKRLIATEIGYHTDLTYTGAHRPVSERAAGFYTPTAVLEGFAGGIERTYFLHLADPWTPAEAQAKGIPIRENTFGLLRHDLSPKPSFLALRNLMRATDAASAPVSSPGALRYQLEGAGPDVRQMLLRSANGTYALVLWRQVSVWDRYALRDLSPAPDRVDVVLGQPVSLARRFEPVESDQERQRWSDPRRIPVDLAGGPVVLRMWATSTQGATTATAGSATVAGTSLLKVSGKGVVGAQTKVAPPKRRRPRLTKRVVLKVRCAAPCAFVTARSKLILTRAGRRRVFRLKPVVVRAKAKPTALRIGVSGRVRRAARRSLKRGGRVRAVVVVTARSHSGRRLARVTKKIYFRAGSL
jgi:hypothetical protein